MPIRLKKHITEFSESELVKTAWAFGIIDSIIGTVWGLMAFRGGSDAASVAVRCFFVLGSFGAYAMGFAAVRHYRAELRRRHSTREKPSLPSVKPDGRNA